MAWKRVWITGAENDAAATRAVRLAKSLRRAMTGKMIMVVPGINVSMSARKLLLEVFDLVLPLDLNAGMEENNVKFEDKVKVCLHGIRLFEKAVFISSSVIVLENIDFIFETLFDGSAEIAKNEIGPVSLSSPIFAVIPSVSNFTYLKTRFAMKPSICTRRDFEDLQSKAAAVFDSFGLVISPDGIPNFVEENDRHIRMVSLPMSIDGNEEQLLEQWGDLGCMIAGVLEDGKPIKNEVESDEEEGGGTVPLERMSEDPIAIVGMACRLPAANDVEEFWNLLINKGDAIGKVPEWRWLDEQVKTTGDKRQKEECRNIQAGWLKCPVDEFDAKFFGMSPKEMEFTDPQQRMLLEVSWEALEDAAVDPTSLHGTQTGIFTGTWTRDYTNLMIRTGFAEEEFFRSYIGNSYGATAGRMAHFYGVTGSNIATESGCSSSMVAVGLACTSLRRHKTDLALACGVNLLLQPFTPSVMVAFCAEDGHCKTFDAAADGFGRAEGCGVVVLKRLSDAVRDGDNIRAVIRGYGEAQEGPSKSLGTPTVNVEALAMSIALKDAEVLPSEVSFVEAHGTGTAVGDPMEMEAIARVYSEGRTEPLVVTSVKTNVGHTESVSGLTGIIKTVLALERQILPPHRALNELNPKIDLSKTPAVIPLEATPWPKDPKKKRIAGVSSFGITGTDGHVILEEAPPNLQKRRRKSAAACCSLLALSARSEAALEELIQKYANKLKGGGCKWSDVTFTANTGRAHFKDYRTAIVAKDCSDFQRQVERQSIKVIKLPSTSEESRPRVVFLFTGQGSQYPGMAKEVYDTSPQFRRLFDKCDRILRQVYDIDIKRALWASNESEELLHQTLYSQTAIFVVDFCLAELWKSWGVTPDIVVGHSLGEYAAATVAGILSMEDALKLVAERSRLIDKLPCGKMIVVNVDYKATCQLLEKIGSAVSLDVAAMNSPEQTTLAGTAESVLMFKQFCDNNGVKSRVLDATHAFHSQMMDAALPSLRTLTQSVDYGKPTCTFVSGMEGKEVSHLTPEYWVRHTREPVDFVKACGCLRGENRGIVGVEVGPQPVLSSFVARNLEGTSTCLLPSLRRSKGDWETLLDSLGRLYTSGVEVDWRGFHGNSGGLKVAGLPTYPFQRKKFWFAKPKSDELLFNGESLHPLLQFRFPAATPTRVFHSRLSLSKLTYVNHHMIGSHVIFPAAGYLEMLLAAGHCATLAEFEGFRFPRQPLFLSELIVDAPMKMTSEDDTDLQMIVAPADDTNWNAVSIHRRAEDAAGTKSWLRHSNAKFSSFSNDSLALEIPDQIDVARLTESLPVEEMDAFYESIGEVGLKFGETFRSVKRVWKSDKEALAEIASPEGADYFVHPVAIDGMIQTLMAAQGDGSLSQLMVPVKIDHFAWFGTSESSTTSFFVYVDKSSSPPSAVLLDVNGTKLAVMTGVTLVPTSITSIETALQSQHLVLPDLLEEEWVPMKSSSLITNMPSICPVDFLNSPPGLRVLEHERAQSPLTAQEKWEIDLGNEIILLQCLQAFLEIGWTPKVSDTVDVRQFILEFKIPQKNLLPTRRYFEIISSHSSFLEKLDDFTFHVRTDIPSVFQIEERIAEIVKLFRLYEVEKECVRSIASSVSGVLLGKDSVLPILFGDERIAEKVYTEFQSCRQANDLLVQSVRSISEYARETQDERTLRILEIGGGTGGSTRAILPALQETGVDFSYTFTDISASFFPAAETLLSEWKDRMEYKVLDIEKDPKTQGFVPEDFDVVVATHVLHATRNITETMRSVRHLLKPNGVILVVELYEPQLSIDVIFGLVDGYWRFEDVDQRPLHCILPEETWPKVLTSAGFTPGLRLVKIACGNAGVIVAQATAGSVEYSVPALLTTTTWVVVRGLYDDGTVEKVTEQLQWQGRRVISSDHCNDIVEWKSEVESGKVEGILFLSDGKRFDAEEATKRFLKMIQTLLNCRMSVAPKIVVVTRGMVTLGDQGEAYPHGGTLWGMSRSLRSENSTYRVLNVDLDPNAAHDINASNLLNILWSGSKADFIAIRDQKIFMAKLKRWKVKNTSLALPQNAPRFGLILPTSNAINDLMFGTSQRHSIGANQVEIEMKAAALNFRDLFSVLKPSKEFEKNAAVGTDMAGVVTSVGPDVMNLKVGDAVIGCFFEYGGLPSHVVVPANRVAKLPSNLTFADGSTLPAVFSTAYYSLVDVARLKKGETILIHTASGGVGIAAIQVARQVGAKIIATAGNRRKRSYLREVWGIEHVFHSRDLTYREDILAVTGGRGVDVILNSLTGPGFKEATLDVCTKGGRFIEMSKLNVWSIEDVHQRRPDVNYQIVDLTSVSEETSINLLHQLEEFMERGHLSPLPYELFDSVDIREALTHLQKARHIGKIVCKFPETFAAGKDQRRHLLFNERSTYLITGGLGGIGLEAAKWMASEGAKFLVLCGRSPPNDKAIQVISELKADGKFVTSVQLDIGNFEDSRLLIEQINRGELCAANGEKFPPLRGIQHAAGCLSDATFPNQTWEKYEETFNAKVKGTWNLHQLTQAAPFPLEHFVMYSSFAGVLGSIGQSNHAAANAFMDAMAHFRNARGLPATSVNWGQWGQVGVAADLELNFLTPFTPLQGFSCLKEILRHHKVQSGAIESDFSKLKLVFPWISRGYANAVLNSNGSVGDKRNSYSLTTDKFWEEIDGANGDPKETEIVLQRILSNVVRQILKLEDEEVVDVDGNLQEMGLDSLMMVELKNMLQSALGSKVTLTADAFSEANTIKKLATRLRKLIVEDEELTPEEKVKFILEQATSLPDSISTEKVGSRGDLSQSSEVNLLLVGTVNSSFGAFVLENLTRRKNISKVVVLSSTSLTTSESIAEKIKEETGVEVDVKKIQVIEQDEDIPTELGIPHSDYERLVNEIDAIVDIRLQATSQEESTSAIKKEAELTLRLLEFATMKKLKLMCHVNKLLPQRKGTDQNQSVLEECLPSGNKEDLDCFVGRGYSSSQFISECFLREANSRGVPCRVFRLPHLSGDSRTGRFQLQEGHIFTRYMQFIMIGKIPSVPVPFSVIPVDQAATLCVRLLWSTCSNTEESSPSVFNLNNPHEYSLSDFISVSEEMGKPMRIVELEEFLSEKNSIVETITFTFGDPLDFSAENSVYSGLAKSEAGAINRISIANTQRLIGNLKEVVEKPLDILRRDLKFAQDSGLFQKYMVDTQHRDSL